MSLWVIWLSWKMLVEVRLAPTLIKLKQLSPEATSVEASCECTVQVPACVADATRDHLLFNNAQLGAGHELSNRSTAVVQKAHDVIKVFTLRTEHWGRCAAWRPAAKLQPSNAPCLSVTEH